MLSNHLRNYSGSNRKNMDDVVNGHALVRCFDHQAVLLLVVVTVFFSCSMFLFIQKKHHLFFMVIMESKSKSMSRIYIRAKKNNIYARIIDKGDVKRSIQSGRWKKIRCLIKVQARVTLR